MEQEAGLEAVGIPLDKRGGGKNWHCRRHTGRAVSLRNKSKRKHGPDGTTREGTQMTKGIPDFEEGLWGKSEEPLVRGDQIAARAEGPDPRGGRHRATGGLDGDRGNAPGGEGQLCPGR